jgi:hypothetical protein
MKYSVGQVSGADAVRGGILRYAVVVNDRAVIERRPNGQSFYMTYKSVDHARRGLARARTEQPGALIFDRGGV